jgi:hypothetical protein
MSYAKVTDDWESDLALLRDKYYLDFFHFGWPASALALDSGYEVARGQP